MTIAESLYLFNNQTTRQQIECVAIIKDILASNNKTWYYKSCNLCQNRAFKTEATTSAKGKEVVESKDFYSCETHETVTGYIFRYCVSALLEDLTGRTTATFFDEPMASLVGESCDQMIKTESYPTAKDCPATFQKLIGREMKFRLQHRENNRQPDTCVVNRVCNLPAPTTDTEIPATKIPPPTPDKKSSKRQHPDTIGTDSPPMKEAKN
ncbi:uncharacterized protein LOC143628404 [Bidens hawaiensis]|uniref:uncharacterized protein LOC143628404 n=1 Tax=Bidens hawaiensis TaxID=980011 RepID=UPI00404912F2